ncbi:TRAP transporter small permease subunit [Alkalibacillus aidingensis]|uniref:TRAP transporter small permease subunit n=1 Tax=Alkalibacillus aidingensis TaxID=2747607 RepID=UPI00166045D6|nr:TRAP transporter small permease subunit [Alkalibacillus aidingensis]
MVAIEKAYHIFEKIKLIGVWISGISLFGMMLFIVIDVVLRNLFNSSISGGFEMVQNYFMTLTVFPALAYVYSSGVLPKMDLLIERFQDQVKKLIIFFMIALEVFILAIMFYFSLDYAINGFERSMSFPAAGTLYPIYPFLFLIPLAFFLIVIENMFILIKNIMFKEPSFLFKGDSTQDSGE